MTAQSASQQCRISRYSDWDTGTIANMFCFIHYVGGQHKREPGLGSDMTSTETIVNQFGQIEYTFDANDMVFHHGVRVRVMRWAGI